MRRVSLQMALLSLAGAMVLLSACGGGGDDEADAAEAALPTAAHITTQKAEVSILVFDNTFSHSQRTVKVGDEVHWDWDGKNPHSVAGTFDGAAVESGQLTGKNRFTFKFEKAGTFEYQCGVHGAGMAGKITVQQ